MLLCLKDLGCNMSVKLHYLNSHLDHFPENLGHFSDEQGERFHQEIRTMDERYKGRWNVHMMSDYCWSLKLDLPRVSHAKKIIKKIIFGGFKYFLWYSFLRFSKKLHKCHISKTKADRFLFSESGFHMST
ncbi:unnamed protein product [Euphydryas editha]|uniref:Uncharacterized protein n=1 Tax=Euphydryas editha TaxID=104508 RepID=A0AAU9TCU1_EUPED|nr:unnamed protein product [Euphydryas editha]